MNDIQNVNYKSDDQESDDIDVIASDIENDLFENNLLIKSRSSEGLNAYIINSPKNVQLEFIYNYFVKNERELNTNNAGNSIIIEENNDDNFDVDYLIKSKTIPRSVSITYTRPAGYVDTSLTDIERNEIKNFDLNNISTDASDPNPKNLLFGFELTDVDGNDDVLNKLKLSSIILKNEPVSDSSYQDMAKSLSDMLGNPGGLTGNAKKILLQKFNATRSKGFAVSPNENSKARSNDPVSNENFSIKINNIFAPDNLKYATTVNAGLYETELLGIKNYAKDIRARVLESLASAGGVNSTSESDYAIFATPVATRPILDNVPIEQQVTKKLAGYLIEKTEQLPNESFIKRPTRFVLNPNQLQVFDDDVRYGGKYIYKVRSVILFEAPSYMLGENPALDQLVLAKFLIASEGSQKSVFCVENIPPPAPSGIRCRFDFKRKKPVLAWQFPLNKQRDIKRFQVFKRLTKNEPFTLIAEYNFDNSTTKTAVKEVAMSKNLYNLNPKIPKLTHMDMTYNESQKPIYTVSSVDAHGLTSNLGTQIKVEYLKYENRLKKTLFSRAGAPKQYPNIFMENDTFLDNVKSSGDNRMILFFTPEYYQVFKNLQGEYKPANTKETVEADVTHIAADPTEDTYKIQIINLDLQKDQLINVRIEDASSPKVTSTGSTFNVQRHNNFLN